MRGFWIAGLIGACLAAPWASALGAEPVERLAAKNGWLDSYQAGQDAARRSGRPMFVVFRCQP